VKPDSAPTCRLLDDVRRGDRRALERLLARYRPDMEAFLTFHLDARLRARSATATSHQVRQPVINADFHGA
jgi:hypothetical protein